MKSNSFICGKEHSAKEQRAKGIGQDSKSLYGRPFALNPLRLTLCSQIPSQRLQSTFDRFERSREGETHVSFTIRAKHRARHRGDLCAIEQDLRRFATVTVNARNIGKGIEGTGGQCTCQAEFI